MRGFARPRYHRDRVTSRDFRRRSLVTIDVHGPLDRVKDVSPVASGTAAARVGCVRLAHADDVPLLSAQRAPAVTGARAREGRDPHEPERTGQDLRCYDPPRRVPSSGRSGCLPPLRRRAHERIAPLSFPRRPPAHAAHTFSTEWGEVLSRGIASVLSRSEPRGGTSREQTPFETRWKARAWA